MDDKEKNKFYNEKIEFSDYFSQLFTVNGEGDGEDEESADEEEI